MPLKKLNVIFEISRIKSIGQFFQAANALTDAQLVLMHVNDPPVNLLFLEPFRGEPQKIGIVCEDDHLSAGCVFKLHLVCQTEIA